MYNKQPIFAVLGAGNGGMAIAGHLGLMGFEVRLFNRSPERLDAVKAHGGIELTGQLKGFGEVKLATTDMKAALEGADVIMVVVPASAHEFMAQASAHHLRDGQIVVLNPGRTGGALQFAKILRNKGIETYIFLAETQTLLYACRVIEPAKVEIFQVKNSVSLATLPAYWIPDVLQMMRPAFPQFVPGDNVFKTSLENIGAIFHPALLILNAPRIEMLGGDFDYYMEGIAPYTSRILEALDSERVAVAAALGIGVNTAREWLYLAYDVAGKTLCEAVQSNLGYKGIKAPNNLEHRYITEDVPYSLVPIASLGELLGVSTPTIKSVIQLASVLHQRDYWSEGRTVEKLGLEGLSVKQIRLLAVMGFEAVFSGGEPHPAFIPNLTS